MYICESHAGKLSTVEPPNQKPNRTIKRFILLKVLIMERNLFCNLRILWTLNLAQLNPYSTYQDAPVAIPIQSIRVKVRQAGWIRKGG